MVMHSPLKMWLCSVICICFRFFYFPCYLSYGSYTCTIEFQVLICKNQDSANLALMDTMIRQLCSGVDENAVGACAQLVFAPIDESFADDAPLLPSGFRVIPLDSKTVK